MNYYSNRRGLSSRSGEGLIDQNQGHRANRGGTSRKGGEGGERRINIIVIKTNLR